MEAPITLVVGLGNPGPTYEATRHNLGFRVVERFLKSLPRAGAPEHTAESYLWSCRYAGRQVLLQTPLTFKNKSGAAVAKIARRLQLPPEQILVVYDELDLPLGRLRLRQKGSSGGNRGIESILAELGSDRFRRLRLGIDGPHRSDAVDYVLSPFAADEQDLLERVLSEADATLKTTLRAGFTRAMNQYNSTDLRLPSAADTEAPPDKPEHEESDS